MAASSSTWRPGCPSIDSKWPLVTRLLGLGPVGTGRSLRCAEGRAGRWPRSTAAPRARPLFELRDNRVGDVLVQAVPVREGLVGWRRVRHGAVSATGGRKPLSRLLHPSPAPHRPFPLLLSGDPAPHRPAREQPGASALLRQRSLPGGRRRPPARGKRGRLRPRGSGDRARLSLARARDRDARRLIERMLITFQDTSAIVPSCDGIGIP
jgi:hypothetical protein